MKTLKPFLYSLVVFAIVLSACKKNVHKIGDDENPNIQLRNFEDLVILEDFDWKMTLNSPNTLKTSGFTYHPEAGYSTLAFEDLWPSKGDYDFNDLVVEYQFKTATDASNNITEIVGTFIFRAVGAGAKNGFGFELTGLGLYVDSTDVTGHSVMGGGSYISSTDGWEDGQSSAVVIVADDVTEVLPLWSNTSGYGGITKPAEIVTITITPKFGVEIDSTAFSITELNFNPFMIIDYENNGRGREVHKLDYPPTSLADLSLFGTEDDYSSSTFGLTTYKTIKNFPWVLDIPSTVMVPTSSNSVFHYPTEKSDINWAYLHFAEWAESGGTAYNGTSSVAWWLGTTSGFRNNLNIYAP
jgi:LruC domain-containing protein